MWAITGEAAMGNGDVAGKQGGGEPRCSTEKSGGVLPPESTAVCPEQVR